MAAALAPGWPHGLITIRSGQIASRLPGLKKMGDDRELGRRRQTGVSLPLE